MIGIAVVSRGWDLKKSTFRPGNYVWRFSYGFRRLVRDLGEWRPGFYSEFVYGSRGHSGLASGAIFRKVCVLTLVPKLPCSFFQEQVPKMDSSPNVAIRKEHGDMYKYIWLVVALFFYTLAQAPDLHRVPESLTHFLGP